MFGGHFWPSRPTTERVACMFPAAASSERCLPPDSLKRIYIAWARSVRCSLPSNRSPSHYKEEIDPTGSPQVGLVAEDVGKVNSALVVHDNKGKTYSVRYDQVNAMLLNEFIKEQDH